MLRALLICVATLWATIGHAETVRQFTAETSTPLNEIVLALKKQVPGRVFMTGEHQATLSFAGNSIPPRLAGFLATAFEHLPSEVLVPGNAVSLSLMLNGQGAGTEMSLVMMAAFPTSGVPLVSDSMVVMDGSGPGACTGQMVVHHLKPKSESRRVWEKHLESEGFAIVQDDPKETSFLIGHRPGCEITLYLQPERNTTMVVIRYLEE